MTSSERRRGEQRGLSPAATPSPSYGLLLPEEGTVAGDHEPILARAFAALDCEKLDIGEVVTFKTDELAVEVDLDPGVVVLLGGASLEASAALYLACRSTEPVPRLVPAG